MEKVCGTDGRTYENAAQLKYESCMNNTQAEVKHNGSCSQGILILLNFFKCLLLCHCLILMHI